MATRKYKLDERILDNIDTEEKAYFLGLFYADGYNNEKQGKIVLTLQEKDKEILLKLSNSLFFDRPLYHTVAANRPKEFRGYTLAIANKYLSQRLSTLGSPQKKSFVIKFPFWLEERLWQHFIRGYFDGDGSCIKNKNKYNNEYKFAIHIASNFEFCNGLISAIHKLTNLNFKLTKSGKIYIAWLGGNRRVEKFMSWLYQSHNITLRRKYQRYLSLIQQNQNIDDRKTYVYYSKSREKWVARASLKFKRKFLGYFNSKILATKHAKKILLDMEKGS